MINELVEKENEKFFLKKSNVQIMRPTCCIYNRASQKKSKTLYTGYTPQSTVIPRLSYNMFNIP